MRTALLALPWLFAGLMCAVWAWQAERPGQAQGLALTVWLLAGLVAGWAWRRPALGVLRWDGQRWCWSCQGRQQTGELSARLDWQQGLLLEFTSTDGINSWLWLDRRLAPHYWDALRRAVYARRWVSLTADHAPGLAPSRGLEP